MRSISRADAGGRPALQVAFAIWALFALVALAIVITYSRLPAEELYNVSREGIAGGLGRALVFLNFPGALAAIALAGLAAARAERRAVDILAAVATLLCLCVAVPGVVEQGDLDAAPENAIPAAGVLLALGLTVYVARRDGLGRWPRRLPLDRLRLALAVVLVLASIPWIAAELGFYLGLGGLFMSDEVVPEPGNPGIRAVHLGEHHGFDGVLLALAGLGLSRELGRIGRAALRRLLTAVVSFLLVFGLANAVQDFWLEQLVKRGTTSVKIPSMVRPEPEPQWLALVAAMALLYVLLERGSRKAGAPA